MKTVVALFAGDSGDGIQLLGTLFSDTIALQKYNLKTFPDFPAEIRAPAGTVNGVSGFQIQWGGADVYTPGDAADIFVAFNAAAFKKFYPQISKSALVIYDPEGFDSKNCKLAQFDATELDFVPNPKLSVALSQLTQDCLNETELSAKEKNQNKNIFALGLLLFAVEHKVDSVLNLMQSKFGKKQQVFDAMTKTLKMGFYYAETIEFSISFVNEIPKLDFEKGLYRNIQGNTAVALAIVASRWIFDKTVFFGGYPITPASDILHELVKHNYEGIEIMQAEDEIAAVSMAIGAAYGGAIGVTASSGPGIDLKQEAISLAQSAELPLLIIDVMRAGPSTGMPTKLEQSDLETVYYGRHGESPVPIVAIKSPSTAFETTLKAIEIMIKYQTPVFLLSDVSIANGSESWKIPNLSKINIPNAEDINPFDRNENLVKPWIKPGTPDRQFIIGGLEKNSENGGISYDPKNHEVMTQIRSQKVQNIAKEISQLELDTQIENSNTLIISWGSTYGSVKSAVKTYNESEKESPISHLHLEWIHPFPSNLDQIINSFEKIAVAELNAGQLANIIASRIGKSIEKINKIQGIPFLTNELIDAFKNIK